MPRPPRVATIAIATTAGSTTSAGATIAACTTAAATTIRATTARATGVPPGLAKKPGGMPPGQYKKLYTADHGAYVLSDVLGHRGYTIVRRADAGTSEYVYYRDRDGRIRRAIVSPGDDRRLRFSNVPSSLLSEVLSRLY